MGVLAIHGQSYKKQQLAALDRHNLRLNKTYGNLNIDLSKSKDNVILIKPKGGLFQAAKARIEQDVLPHQTRALRKDANWIAEFVVTMPDDVRDLAQIKEYSEAVLDHFSEKIGKENIVSAVIHMDETTPHLHLDFVPITKNHKLSSKEIMTRTFLTGLHDDLPKILQKSGFNVARGESTAKADRAMKSRDIQTYKKDMEAAKADLTRQIKALELIKQKLIHGNVALAKQIIEKFRSHGNDLIK